MNEDEINLRLKDIDLRLMELEVKRLEFLYKSYPDYGGTESYMPNNPREYYVGVAHTETARLLDEFKRKWKND